MDTAASQPDPTTMASSSSSPLLKYKNTNKKKVLSVKKFASPLFWSSG